MSYRPPKNVKRGQPQRARGASRPIDPRYAPGGPPKRGLDSFGIGLIVVSAIAILAVVLVLALQGRPASTTTVDLNPTDAGADPPANATAKAIANVTATAIAFGTLTAPSVLPRITVQETKVLYDANDVMIIDVREEKFYTQGHIKGAVSIPQATVQTRLAEIPKTGNVVVYCDCPHDEESAGVAYSLRSVGYTNIKVLEGPRALAIWTGLSYPLGP